jgi:hypothetical protein
MAIDQRNISSQLRMMDDRALQQYASMHKSDPYIFPLAFQESQNRQKIRMSGQARMAGQEMPKVNDAALMAMAPQAAPPQAPEGQGISNLPAPNMQRMADGGIAGYEDDEEGMATGGMGGMFNFAQQSEPVVRMSGGGVPGYAAGVYNEERFRNFLQETGQLSKFANATPSERQKILTEFADRTSGPKKAAAPTASTPATPAPVKAAAAPEDPRLLRKISEKVGSSAATLLKRAGPIGLGIEAAGSAGDYKIKSPDNIDTSLMGTARDIGQGEFGRAAKGLGLGLAELGMDAGSFGANMLDYVVPGKAPVSSRYEKLLKENIDQGYTLEGPSDRAQQKALNAEKDKSAKKIVPRRSADAAELAIEEDEIKARDNPPFIYDETTRKMVRNPNADKAKVGAGKPSAGGAGTGGGKAKTKVEAPAPTTDAPANLGIVPYGQSKAGDALAAPAYKPLTAEEARAASDKMAEPNLAEIQKSYKPFAEQFAQDRTRIEGREKNNLSDALIRGGLKALGGKSQYAMQNISEGGLEGLNAYQEAQKANEASRRALTQSEMLMTQAQRVEERGARAEAAGFYAQADKSQQAAAQFGQKAQEIEGTRAYQQGVLEHYKRSDATAGRMADASMVSAQNRGIGSGAMALSREAKLQLEAAKLELTDISKQLQTDIRLNLPKNAEAKARLEARRNQLRASIAQISGSSTMPEIPLTGSGGGDKVLDFSKIP